MTPQDTPQPPPSTLAAARAGHHALWNTDLTPIAAHLLGRPVIDFMHATQQHDAAIRNSGLHGEAEVHRLHDVYAAAHALARAFRVAVEAQAAPGLAARIGALEGNLDDAHATLSDYRAALTAAQAELDGLTAGGRLLGHVVEGQARALYAAWIEVAQHRDLTAAAKILSEQLDGFDGPEWDGTETGLGWLDRTRRAATREDGH